MISKQIVTDIVNQWLEETDYFLVDVEVNADNRIVVEIDHADGVWIEDCVELSRFIEDHFDREQEDFELEVGSAGIGQPFKVIEQYQCHVGKDVEVLAADGKKYRGILKDVADGNFTVTVEEKVKREGEKRPHIEEVDHDFKVAEVKYCKYLLKF
ncbi:MAG: ribosome assembly cofactor RimP [Bacteroidaceae bacterium]|nr:ribosome assembly cofactor RimP [Bacteroidaceae bacterium]